MGDMQINESSIAAAVVTGRRKTKTANMTRQRQKVARLTEAVNPVVADQEGRDAGQVPVKTGQRKRRRRARKLTAATRSRSQRMKRMASLSPMKTFQSSGLGSKN